MHRRHSKWGGKVKWLVGLLPGALGDVVFEVESRPAGTHGRALHEVIDWSGTRLQASFADLHSLLAGLVREHHPYRIQT